MKRFTAPKSRGFLLLEVTLALVVIGGLMALMIPLLSMQTRLSQAQQDALAMQQARDALQRQVFDAWGFPGPLRFAEDGTRTSHLLLMEPQVVLGPGWAGALPGSVLGVPTISTLQTGYFYDVQPALRSDADTAFYPKVEGTGSNATFAPIVTQFEPTPDSKLGTGGLRSQLCRNLNSLLAIEQGIRAWTLNSVANYRRDYSNVLLPRFWVTGYEDHFGWDTTTGYATHINPLTGAELGLNEAFENSSAAAFVVVRRQPPALRRLDRQNAQYTEVLGTGLDVPLDDRSRYPLAGVARGFRIYENPTTPARDNPTADTNDYDGRVQAVSLHELANSLRSAGVCVSGAESCKANQLFVRFANYVKDTSATPQGLTMHWELMHKDTATGTFSVVQSADVTSGTTSAGVCLDAFSTDVATTASNRYLRVSFMSPNGTKGYIDPTYWYRGGLLVDPDPSAATSATDDGVTRWRNLSALSAAQAGNTVTVSCTGSHSVSSNELVRAGPLLPLCTVSQVP